LEKFFYFEILRKILSFTHPIKYAQNKEQRKKSKAYPAFILKRKFVLFYNKYIFDFDFDLFEELNSRETRFAS
jgi:hypothetical protein